MKRVLVIGENSYIGQSFARYLDVVNESINKNKTKDRVEDLIEVHLVGASNGKWKTESFDGYDTVLHLASIVHIKDKRKNKQLYYDINCNMAVEVAKKAMEAGVKQFIFLSSASVFNSKETCITKETKPNPNTYYGKSKLAAEKKLTELSSDDDSFSLAIVRPPMVYGEGCKGNYPRLVKLVRFTPIFPEYNNKRSMIAIDNLCEFLSKLVLEGQCGIYHPQDEEYVDTVEMVREIAKNMGKRIVFTKRLNGVIRFLIPRMGIVGKVFGDFLYIKN